MGCCYLLSLARSHSPRNRFPVRIRSILGTGSTSALDLEGLDNTSHRLISLDTAPHRNLPAFSFLRALDPPGIIGAPLNAPRMSGAVSPSKCASCVPLWPPPPPNLAFTTEATRTYQLREICIHIRWDPLVVVAHFFKLAARLTRGSRANTQTVELLFESGFLSDLPPGNLFVDDRSD
ncbi:hypothetical protein C8F01DRAFT_1252940 [Mycena amicta]|nr:hypothetical protein C8F01DRAFT_1252940 [Mycena amicta]